MTSDEDVVSYSVWTLLPNLNSTKIRLTKIRQKTPNQIILHTLQQFHNCGL
jgi:hypothetical protein